MAFEDWEKDSGGNIKICPLSGYETFVPFGMMCGIRVQYVENEGERLSGGGSFLPLVMQPSQAREVAAALNRCADLAERPPSGETPQ
jgi:hypothetical protein